jgi:hypothetical protein
MWWTEYQNISTPFFAPMMWFLLMVMCTAGAFFMLGIGKMQHTGPQLPTDRLGTFEDDRNETMRRADQYEKEFTAFMNHLRATMDKAEFDQPTANRRTPSTSVQV